MNGSVVVIEFLQIFRVQKIAVSFVIGRMWSVDHEISWNLPTPLTHGIHFLYDIEYNTIVSIECLRMSLNLERCNCE